MTQTRPIQVLCPQPAYRGSHFSSTSQALPVAKQAHGMLEQPGISSVHQTESPCMCRPGSPHGSEFIVSIVKATRFQGRARLVA